MREDEKDLKESKKISRRYNCEPKIMRKLLKSREKMYCKACIILSSEWRCICIKFIGRRYIKQGYKKENPAKLNDTEPPVKIWMESAKLDNINLLNKDLTRVEWRRGNSFGKYPKLGETVISGTNKSGEYEVS